MSTPFASLGPGARVGPYEIVRLLGRGGMGAVFGAKRGDGGEVALKVIAPELATDLRLLERFEREARAGQRVKHPNLTAVLDVGEDRGLHFIVLELVAGGTLQDLVKRAGPVPWARAALLGADIARGLGALHGAGLVHRDLKPANVLLDGDRARVSDLGLIRDTDRGVAPLTRTNEIVGTHEYMAPEQVDDARKTDARTDLHALGATLYFALTGEAPFQGHGPMVLAQVLGARPRPVREHAPDCPPLLEALVLRLLEKDPAKRGSSALEVALELTAIGRPARPRRLGVALGAGLLALLVAGTAALLPRHGPGVATPAGAGTGTTKPMSLEYTGELIAPAAALVAIASEHTVKGRHDLALAAWSRVIDSTFDPKEDAVGSAFDFLAKTVTERPPAPDRARARPWRARVVLFRTLEPLSRERRGAAAVDEVRLKVLADAIADAFQGLDSDVLRYSRGAVRVDHELVIPADPLMGVSYAKPPKNRTGPPDGTPYVSPHDLAYSLDGAEDGVDEVFVVAPFAAELDCPPNRIHQDLLFGTLHSYVVRPTPEDIPLPSLREGFRIAAAHALELHQGWPRASDNLACLTDAQWRTLSAREAPRNAWTRGDLRSIELQDPFEWRGDLRGDAFRAAAETTAATATVRSLSTGLLSLPGGKARLPDEHATIARAWVFVPGDVTATLSVRWDDRIVVHYDGRVVFQGPAEHSLHDPAKETQLTLRAGWHPLQVDLGNVMGGWGFALRFRDAHGKPLERIEFAAKRP